MIDVVNDRCCLLADHFFLVSSHLARQEHRLPVELPFAEKFSPLDPEKQSLTISVDLDRQIYVSGDDVDISQLRQILAQRIIRLAGASAAIRIRTDKASRVPFNISLARGAHTPRSRQIGDCRRCNRGSIFEGCCGGKGDSL